MIRLLAGLLVSLLLASALHAEVEVEVRFGHGGRAVVGAVTPTLVRLKSVNENGPVRVTITVQAGSGMFRGERCTSFGALGPGGEKDFRFYLRPTANGTPDVRLSFDRPVVVIDQSKARSEPTESISITPSLPQAYSDNASPASLQLLAVGPNAGRIPRDYQNIQILPVEEEDLPDMWHGYDGIDAVYLRNPFEEEPADPVRLKELLTWVELGGTLVVSATRRPDLVRASLLGDALPAEMGSPDPRPVSYRDLGRNLAWSKTDLDGLPAHGPFIELVPEEGAVQVRRERISGQQRVVSVTGLYGIGRICVLAWDPARFETSPAPYSAAVLVSLLGIPTPTNDPIKSLERAFADIGDYPSMSAESDYTSGITRVLKVGALKAPPIVLLSLFMLLYVFAVGPLDYFFLKRRGWLKYSALSFVILALLFSATAWFVSFYLFAGSTKVNRVTFVDIIPEDGDTARDLVTINDFTGYYAPRGASLDLKIEADTAVFSQLGTLDDYLNWGGGGLTADALDVNSNDPARSTASLSIPFRSLRSARLLALRRELVPLSAVTGPDGKTMVVTNDLPFAIHGAVIITPEGAFPVGDMDSGTQRICPIAPGTSRTQLPDATRLRSDTDDGGATPIDELGPFFLSVGRYIHDDPVSTGLTRILAKTGFARPHLMTRQRSMLVAWTDARDPFRLPGGDEDGLRVTVIRRILDK